MGRDLLKVRNLTKTFYKIKGQAAAPAVDHVSFSIKNGESLGIVGESGSGKTTVARMIAGLERPTEGEILFHTRDLGGLRPSEYRLLYRHIQMVFQSPNASFDPRRSLAFGITEPLLNAGYRRGEAETRLLELCHLCGMDRELADRFPWEVSGGQCQRAAIARALALQPELLILDEPTSALDVTVQKQILDLLADLRRQFQMSFLFITHDIAVAERMCDGLIVMKEGVIVEENSTEELIRNPRDPYTRLLLEHVL